MAYSASRTTTARDELIEKFGDRLIVNPSLNRSLVSYQSNRNRPFYRWFKYKEGFSAALVEWLIEHFGLRAGRVLDPFAGTGAALLAAREAGLDAFGIELLPVGCAVFQGRLAAGAVSPREFAKYVQDIRAGRWRDDCELDFPFQHLRITQGAFPTKTERDLTCFRSYVRSKVSSPFVKELLEVATLATLEAVSFTRKDGQYLRWDSRAPRNLPGRAFHKGPILSFEAAINRQLGIMLQDLRDTELFPLRHDGDRRSAIMRQGSCLQQLPDLPEAAFDLVITSPPYCNRYDYTRTYALELAYLGVDEAQLKDLRQCLLSCTVENQSKVTQLREAYERRNRLSDFEAALSAFEHQDALQEVLSLLEQQRASLNNPNIPRMVRNYFLESAIVIFELGRVVKTGGYVAMINDNVQYHGEEIPVDLILSSLAEEAGFSVEVIWVLQRGKGNSSQQMGLHGRNELRKCAYVWRRR